MPSKSLSSTARNALCLAGAPLLLGMLVLHLQPTGADYRADPPRAVNAAPPSSTPADSGGAVPLTPATAITPNVTRPAQEHYASGQPSPDALSESDFTALSATLMNGWQDWSWATHDVPRGTGASHQSAWFLPENWKGFYLHHDQFAISGYAALRFRLKSDSARQFKLSVAMADASGNFGPRVPIAPYLKAGILSGEFHTVTVPLSALTTAGQGVTGICIQDGSGASQPRVYVRDVVLTAPPEPREISVSVSIRADQRRPISPYIYGMANGSAEYLHDLRLPISRWGGNPSTRYNWVRGNAWNAARDWEFRNGNYGANAPADRLPSGAADKSIAEAARGHSRVIITIPTMGWVARDDNQSNRSDGVPAQGGDPATKNAEAIQGYNPAENRKRVSVPSFPRKGAAFDLSPPRESAAIYQDEWVNHLVHRFGNAAHGGVPMYAMDNEPDLWDVTHTDMHPVRAGYDEVLSRFVSYASAVKAVDPTASILGPVCWGWTGFFYSSRDRGEDNFKTHADRMAHGNLPFVPWFLRQMRSREKQKGQRLLDVLDVHFYPQEPGVYGNSSDPASQALRLRSTRLLWDPAYVDESWIHTPIVLIPRLREWVNRYYPGTRIGLTEWNWGAEQTMAGGVAVAEVLGILGREGVDVACYWTSPPRNSPAYLAYKMYLNADGRGHGFGNIALQSVSAAPLLVSCFASVDSTDGTHTIMLVNKRANQRAKVTVNAGTLAGEAADVYQLSGGKPAEISRLPSVSARSNRLQLVLPAYSITLLRFRKSANAERRNVQ